MNAADRLTPVIERGILTVEPRAGLTGPTGVFAGSYDWHSCVHAHWALASMGHEPFVRQRLTDDVLRAEREFLDENPTFELPYGRAWFVLLLGVLDSEAARAVCKQTRAELLDWLRTSPFPETADGILATHQSWLFTFFLLCAAGDDAELRDMVAARIDPHRELIAAHQHTDTDFIDLPSLLQTIDGLLGTGEVAGGNSFSKSADDPEPADGCGHACGRVAMCLWPDGLRGAPDFEERLRALLDDESMWCGDFRATAHWAPQFIWMAKWLRLRATPSPP